MHIPVLYDPASEPCPTVSDAASRYVELIREHQSTGPYRLAGLCFGGLVAYEAGRQLEAAGEKVELVALFDTRLPQARRIRPFLRAYSILKPVLTQPRSALERSRKRLATRREHHADERSATNATLAELPIRGENVEEQARSYADNASPMDTRVLLFRATKEPDPDWLVYDRDFGWSSLATQIEIFDIPGNHLEIIQSPHSEFVAAAIQQASGSRD
jgi:thioesterase domain-containing protein